MCTRLPNGRLFSFLIAAQSSLLAAHRMSACSQRAYDAKRSPPISSCEEAESRTSDVGAHTCRLCACVATSAPSTRIAFGGRETGSSLWSGRALRIEVSSSSCKKQEAQLLTSHRRHAVQKEISDTLTYDGAHDVGKHTGQSCPGSRRLREAESTVFFLDDQQSLLHPSEPSATFSLIYF